MKEPIEFEVPTGGELTGRDGTYPIKSIVIWAWDTTINTNVNIFGRSRVLGIIINGGFRIEAAELDQLAKQWLRERGYRVSFLPTEEE